MTRIEAAVARAIYDSRGRPTIEVELRAGSASGRGVAPAGASKGAHEIGERRDVDGYGVHEACGVFRNVVAPVLKGMDCSDQSAIDARLIELNGSPRGRLGGNTLIATSMAALQCAAAATREPLWRYLAGSDDLAMPLPEIQIIGGGAHA